MGTSAKQSLYLWVCGALAAGLAGLSAPAYAQTVEEVTVTARFGPDGEPSVLSQAVSYSDLDLTTEAGRDELKRRINTTARDLCAKLGEPGRTSTGPVPSCEQGALDSAREQQRLAIAQARPRALAETSAPPATSAPAPAVNPPMAPAAETEAAPASVTVQTLTNGPIPDTAENRRKYGAPLSRAGKRSAPAGN